MMNVRKYRAETTRDALELVKKELGEDAFVLETKRIRTGGFLGINSKMEIEVSAATSEALAGKEAEKPAESAPSNETRLVDIKDEAAATPSFAAYVAPVKDRSVMSALTSRAASTADFEAQAASLNAETMKANPDTVEINPEAPRFVFPETEKANKRSADRIASKPAAVEARPAGIADRELELLRAELREVKFSLGALAGLQNSRRSGSIDHGIFGMNVEPEMHDVFVELMSVGIPPELAQQFAMKLGFEPSTDNFETNSTRTALLNSLSASVAFEPEVLAGEEGSIMAVIGSTGVGKTTTAAKLAARSALYDHQRVELVTLDTYRIAAVEQLKTYAEIIGAGCHVVRSVFELDAVLCRLPKTAKIIIDTTGRNPHDLADQFEFSDFLQRRTDIRKCLVVQATTHPLDAVAAIRKFEMYGADCLAVTKMDETTRPGATLETIIDSRLPLAYLGTGQRVPEDLQIATAESLTNRILAFRA